MDKHTVQRILNQHLESFLKSNKISLPQHKALRQLSACRTEILGGHAQYCENGHLAGIWYNSCKHRSCPQCRGKATEEWLINTQRILLDCPHHHVIFTLPSELNDLWRFNRALMADILFKAAQETLKTFAKDPQYLNAVPGMLSTLHTWGRSLPLHPHLHVLISHGGVDKQGQWVEPKKKELFPQKPVMHLFRGKMLAMLKQALQHTGWVLPPDRRNNQVVSLFNKLGRRSWVVHFCKRYDYADGVAKYLSRYVKSGPLKNQQIISVTHDSVSLRYKSHETKRMETLTLSIENFIQRLLQHVPVPGKPSVRYSGLYNSAARKKLNIARSTLGQKAVGARQLLQWQDYLENKGGLPVCHACGASIKRMEAIPTQRAAA